MSETTAAYKAKHNFSTNFKEVVKIKLPSFFRAIGGIAVVCATLISCNNTPYTGPILTVDHVDRYLEATGEDTACLQDGFDSICIRVVPEKSSDTDDIAPTIEVHPTSLIYMFYYAEKPILRAERVMDTTAIVQELTGEPATNTNAPNLDGRRFKDWTLQIYYPEALLEADRGTTPETSGLDIRVGTGATLSAKKQNDLQIQDFTQINGLDGSRIAQFSIETAAQALTIQVDGLVSDHTATFYINAERVTSNENTGFLQLQPLQ